MRIRHIRTMVIGMAIFCGASMTLHGESGEMNLIFNPDTREQVLELSLEECVRQAVRRSFDVQIAKLDFLIAESNLGYVESIYDTELSASVTYDDDRLEKASIFSGSRSITNLYRGALSKTLQSGTDVTLSLSDTRSWSDSGFLSQNPAHEALVSFDLRQPIVKNIFGYNDRRTITIEKLSIKNSGLDTKDSIEAIIADVSKAYWRMVFAKVRLDNYKDMLEKALELERMNRRNYDVGRIEKADLLASQANAALREKDVLIAENAYRNEEESLKFLINTDDGIKIVAKDEMSLNGPEYTLGMCIDKAFRKRRDYMAAKRNIEIKKTNLQINMNKKLPQVDLVASLDMNGVDSNVDEAVNRMKWKSNMGYYGGIEVSMPLENRSAESQSKQAEYDLKKASVSLKKTERKILTEVGNAFRDFKTNEEAVDTYHKAVRLQKEKLEEEQKRFNQGRSRTKTLIDYQEDYLRAELGAALGLLDYETSKVDLEKAINSLLEKYEEII